MSAERPPDDRRRGDRRSEDVRLADFTVPQLRKAIVTAVLLVAILALFGYMLRDMLVALVAGIVVGAYLIPLERWVRRWVRKRHLSALITIVAFTVPLIAVLVYSWLEISDAAEYLEANRAAVADRLSVALGQLPFVEGIDIEDDLSRGVAAAANRASDIVEGIQEALDVVVISIAVFLFTVFYILTDYRRIAAYLRRKVPGRYTQLSSEITGNIQSVVYGALYATFLTQLMKSGMVLALNLIWDVPLALVLAILSFLIGFFPIVGSWLVYVPVAVYMAVFENDLFAGGMILSVGFFVNTLFLSMYLRPKLASEQSHVLNFYWMFIALITGVYTFGLVGIIIGPVLIAVLKAIFDTLTGSTTGATMLREDVPRPGAD